MDTRVLKIQCTVESDDDGNGEFYLIDRDSIERIEFSVAGLVENEKPRVLGLFISLKSGASIELSPPFDRFHWSTEAENGESIESFCETMFGPMSNGIGIGSNRQ